MPKISKDTTTRGDEYGDAGRLTVASAQREAR
jgi:hypothetical protein